MQSDSTDNLMLLKANIFFLYFNVFVCYLYVPIFYTLRFNFLALETFYKYITHFIKHSPSKNYCVTTQKTKMENISSES